MYLITTGCTATVVVTVIFIKKASALLVWFSFYIFKRQHNSVSDMKVNKKTPLYTVCPVQNLIQFLYYCLHNTTQWTTSTSTINPSIYIVNWIQGTLNTLSFYYKHFTYSHKNDGKGRTQSCAAKIKKISAPKTAKPEFFKKRK